MKKVFSILTIALALLVSVSSCSKDNEGNNGNEGDGVTGNLTIHLGFPETPNSRAATSTGVIPITTWNKSIKSMMLLLTEGDMIKRVLPINLQNADDFAQISRTFNGLPAATYDIYIVANYGETTTPFGAGSVTFSPAMNGSALLGTDITNLQFDLPVVNPTDKDGAIEKNIVGEPCEIFLAKQGSVAVVADVTTTYSTPFKLKRAVSLLRVRINKVYDSSSAANVDNSSIDFVNGTIRLRRYGLGLHVKTAAEATAKPWGVKGISTSSASADNVFYSNKTFKDGTQFVVSDYKAGANMGINAADFTLWNEYLILPGGNSATGTGTGTTKFNVVLSGKTTTATYIPADRTTAVGVGTTLYWTGQVTGEVAPNGILELNISPKSAGVTTIPEVVEYGNLTISVDLLEWGTTNYVPLPL